MQLVIVSPGPQLSLVHVCPSSRIQVRTLL